MDGYHRRIWSGEMPGTQALGRHRIRLPGRQKQTARHPARQRLDRVAGDDNRDMASHSRGAIFARAVPDHLSLDSKRAQGKPGASRTRSLMREIDKAHERSHHRFSQFSPAFPARWSNGLLRALPGDRALLPPSPAKNPASLTPASGRQDHTTFAVRFSAFVQRDQTIAL